MKSTDRDHPHTTRPAGRRLRAFLRLMRPHQWIKNLFIFLPAFLNGNLTDWPILWHSLLTFLLFSLTSSAVYAVNDSVDAPFDAKNPEKRHRPVASGLISRAEAVRFAFLLVLLVGSVILLSPFPIRALAVPLTVYLALNLSYSFWLKRVPVLDVVIVAGCFLIRVWAGGTAGPVPLTVWTMLLVFILTLFMATGKRRHEAWLCETEGIEGRSNIRHYSLRILNLMMILLGAAAVILYLVWSLSEAAFSHFHTDRLWITAIFALLGIYRYLYLTLGLNKGGSPTKILLHDRTIQTAVILWIVNFILIIHF